MAPVSAAPVLADAAVMVAPALVVSEAPETMPETAFDAAPDELLVHSPPDLYLLHATLLV